MMTFSKLVNTLQRHYGAPIPPPSTDPLELIIWENIAYLASDERRAAAFAALKRDIGTRPEQILAAKHAALAAIGKAGILPDVSAEKLLAIAKIAYEESDSDLPSVLKKPLPQAKKALKRFPSIGDPGAEMVMSACWKRRLDFCGCARAGELSHTFYIAGSGSTSRLQNLHFRYGADHLFWLAWTDPIFPSGI
jgi:endonuclease-3